MNCSKEKVTFPISIVPIPIYKAALQNAADRGNLIIDVSETTINGVPNHLVLFEEGDSLWIPSQWIASVENIPEDWQIKTTFTDNCEQLSPALGSFAEIEVELDPFETAPLTALAKINIPVAGQFEITVSPKGTNGTLIQQEFESSGPNHEIPILGLYADYENIILVTFKSPAGKIRGSQSIFIQTEPCPITVDLNILKNEFPEDEHPIYFIADLKAGFDLQGEIRWYYTGDAFYVFRKAQNGNLIISGQEGAISYHRPNFHEVSMLGETIRTYNVPNMQHHDIREMPNGNFLVGTNSTPFDGDRNDGNLEEDMIIEIDRNSGAIVKSWDLNQLFNNQRLYPGNNVNTDDWLHLNSIFFDDSDQSLIISGRNQSLVAKIDYASGALKWLLAHPFGWDASFDDYLLQPVDENGNPINTTDGNILPYYQHSAMVLPNGNLWLYDNGNFRNYYDDNSVPYNGNSRAVEYKIDEANKTFQVVWSYFPNPSIFTAATGDVDYQPERRYQSIGFMQGSANSPKIMEFDDQRNLIFEMTVNPNVSWFYRFERMDLY